MSERLRPISRHLGSFALGRRDHLEPAEGDAGVTAEADQDEALVVLRDALEQLQTS
jgi:hypothetical protein